MKGTIPENELIYGLRLKSNQDACHWVSAISGSLSNRLLYKEETYSNVPTNFNLFQEVQKLSGDTE